MQDAPDVQGIDRVLTPAASAFVAALSRQFGPRLTELLQRRCERQVRFDAGERLDFLLIKRATHERDPWSGQMAFPGGRRDGGDAGAFTVQ